ncbi:putative rRNA methyltransferase [Nostocoides japonicum T1-X7]|uniref:Putative rRNA methyltransferase n=1 Tax=Nostocoides japonicum T1-X7 TaxID=1194083 RepID=A0A077M008_9MICO|nr:RNA methyltransferase [Tetrasphaera japonica]CCH78462.1 putative rRNA methyltransferase [Tetrasphaera japonica T1-X7]
MLTNPRADRVKAVRALSRRSSRERAGRFVAEGPQSVREAVRYAPADVVDLYADPAAATRHADLLAEARAHGIRVHPASSDVLAAMTETPTHQGLLAVCHIPGPGPDPLGEILASGPRVLAFLTHVRDPGNAGTVIRAADAAGVDAVLLSEGSVDVHAPKVVRSTAGSLFHLPVVTGLPVPATLDRLRDHGIHTLAADGAGSTLLPDADLRGPHAWVFGNEAWGLPPEVRARCDDVVRVPILGRAESLNLATAATVCLYASSGVGVVTSSPGSSVQFPGD